MRARFGEDEGYAGPARITTAGEPGRVGVALEVEVDLRGHFEPIDGHFHWYGRVASCSELDAAVQPGTVVALTTGHGTAVGRLSDVDPWGRFRVAGTGAPPFARG